MRQTEERAMGPTGREAKAGGPVFWKNVKVGFGSPSEVFAKKNKRSVMLLASVLFRFRQVVSKVPGAAAPAFSISCGIG